MAQTTAETRPFAALALILIHLIISTLHGWAHQAAMVTLTTFGYVYVGVVIRLMPLVAAAHFCVSSAGWRRREIAEAKTAELFFPHGHHLRG